MQNLKELQEEASKLTVLYVEDDEDIAKTLVSYLSKFFQEVLYASNGQEGLELYKQNPCDLVITDIKMPKMHGLDMTFEIKQINPNQNVIIISAYSEIDNFLSSIKLGVDGYILKPVNYVDMNNLLFKMVRKIKTFKDQETYVNRINKLIEALSLKNDELNHYTDALNKVAIVSKTDLKGYITFANDFFCDICGYTQEELIGKNHNIIRHPDVPKKVFEDLWKTIQSGNTWEGDVKNMAKNSEPYYVHATIIPLFETDGTTIREYIGIRFLTTSDEMEKREFKKKVMINYQEFRKENHNYKQRIAQLEEELLQIKSEDMQIKQSFSEDKSKQLQLLSQIQYYENEIKKIDSHHDKVLNIYNQNNKKMEEAYNEVLLTVEEQKDRLNHQQDQIEHFTKEKKIFLQKINAQEELIEEQRNIVFDLKDTIKFINDQEETAKKAAQKKAKQENKDKKKGLLDKFL